MAHLTGVFQRGSAFYLRIVLPKGHPLSAAYRNGRFVKALCTCTLPAKNDKSTARPSNWQLFVAKC
jgi:hypothetical protein